MVLNQITDGYRMVTSFIPINQIAYCHATFLIIPKAQQTKGPRKATNQPPHGWLFPGRGREDGNAQIVNPMKHLQGLRRIELLRLKAQPNGDKKNLGAGDQLPKKK